MTREDIDEATALRQAIQHGLREYAVALYRDGKATLAEAAELADVSPRRMLDLHSAYAANIFIGAGRLSHE